MTSRTANLCLAVVFVGWYFVLPEGVAQAVLFDLIGLVAAIAILIGVRLHRPRQTLPWYLFSAGLAFTLAGDIAWDVYDLGLGVDPFPSAADVLYLAAYPCFLVGLVQITRRLGAGQGSAAMMDALIVTAGVAVRTRIFVTADHLAFPPAPHRPQVEELCWHRGLYCERGTETPPRRSGRTNPSG